MEVDDDDDDDAEGTFDSVDGARAWTKAAFFLLGGEREVVYE